MYVIIVGCGRVGGELARLLADAGHNVVIIDKNSHSFDRLGGTFNGLTLVGSGFDVELLKNAGIEKANAFCALTNGDNTNLVAAQVAKRMFKVPKVIARVYDPSRAELYRSLGVDVISGTVLFAAMIRDKIIESRFSSYLIESKDIGMIEIEAGKKLIKKSINEVNIPGELLVVAVKKKEKVILSQASTVLEEGDVLMAVVKIESLEKIKKRFNL